MCARVHAHVFICLPHDVCLSSEETDALPPQLAREIDEPGETDVEVTLTWAHGGDVVKVTGSWDNWSEQADLQKG